VKRRVRTKTLDGMGFKDLAVLTHVLGSRGKCPLNLGGGGIGSARKKWRLRLNTVIRSYRTRPEVHHNDSFPRRPRRQRAV
jgi:hypothetical protein